MTTPSAQQWVASARQFREVTDSKRLPGWCWRLTSTAALLAAVAAAIGLVSAHRIYGRETDVLADAATAQDLVTLVAVTPAMVLLGLAARRGSMRAFLCLPGCLAFTAYNYAIYAFSIHFGPLFLVWVAVLGLSAFALAGCLATMQPAAVERHFGGRPMRGVAWFLIAVAALFALLWLSEIGPDLLAGRLSTSARAWNVPTNPVHVLDLALFLPATIGTGVLLLRRHPLGYATAAAQAVWLALTCLPILVTPIVAGARGHTTGWPVVLPIGVLLLVTTAILRRSLQSDGSNTP